MHKSAIKKNYIVKSVLFISFLCIISLGLIGGCSDGGGGNDSQALTENDFAEDSALRADLERGVVVTFLEAPNSEPPENDTGQVGVDLVPVTYRRTAEQTFCWEDDDVDAMHFMELRDSEESRVLTVKANGDCVTELLREGNYLMSIHHDESVGDALPIFLIPNPEELAEATKTGGLIDRFKLAASNVLKRIEGTVTKDAKAQKVTHDPIFTLIVYNRCNECNLKGADLNGAKLIGAKLIGAKLIGAKLIGAKLIGADLIRANLTDADLSGADLTVAKLNNSILIMADLSGAILTGADFLGARWCDGMCICNGASIGRCGGCPSVDICTGPEN